MKEVGLVLLVICTIALVIMILRNTIWVIKNRAKPKSFYIPVIGIVIGLVLILN